MPAPAAPLPLAALTPRTLCRSVGIGVQLCENALCLVAQDSLWSLGLTLIIPFPVEGSPKMVDRLGQA